jgi:formylglycine-generating enzyme required for sulfatase activity
MLAATPPLSRRKCAMRFWCYALAAAALWLGAAAGAAAQTPGKSFRDCPTCPQMTWVPAGSFTMGVSAADEQREGMPAVVRGRAQPLHQVTFKAPFAVGTFPVTRGEYRAFVQETGRATKDSCYTQHVTDGHSVYEDATGYSWRDPGIPQTDDHPVVCVDFGDATAYAAWLSRKTGHAYRLLSEAEFEYAARGGTRTLFFWGDDRDKACTYANVQDLAGGRSLGDVPMTRDYRAQCDDGYVFTSPVGHFKPNPYGLYDMTGEVWEWVADCWNKTYDGAPTDGSPALTGDCDLHPTAGGSYGNVIWYAHAGARAFKDYDYRGHSFGFRVARSQ